MACCQSTIADNRPHFWSNVGQLLFMYFILILDTCVPLSLLIENRDGWKFSNIVFGTCISLGYFCRLIKKRIFFKGKLCFVLFFIFKTEQRETWTIFSLSDIHLTWANHPTRSTPHHTYFSEYATVQREHEGLSHTLPTPL